MCATQEPSDLRSSIAMNFNPCKGIEIRSHPLFYFQIICMSLFLSLGRIRYNLIHVRLKDLIQFLSATIQKIFEIYACILLDFLTGRAGSCGSCQQVLGCVSGF